MPSRNWWLGCAPHPKRMRADSGHLGGVRYRRGSVDLGGSSVSVIPNAEPICRSALGLSPSASK